ncbi:uncharacterized protein LOC120662576 [Panicum virgatum]|uniref:uncharacterized protein LOC120662576 n=1 Tax=Panicum virgatum TaxID=38727 RepID=UPI0019D6574E|nr:uncharacterized protein LOC120662576 [Panicum virgatum]
MDRAWMYNANRMGAYFRGELDKFIKVAENYARKEKTQLIHCPCRACENLKVFSDPTTIRSHVMVSGFIKDYTIWKKYGETDAPPPTNNPLDEIIRGEELDRMFDAYYDFGRDDDGVSVDDGAGGFHSDDVDDRPIDSDSSEDELDDGDFLSQLLRHTKEEVLATSARGLPNFETVRKSTEKNIYERSKGCPKHWTVLHFILEQLTLKAKHSWSYGSFNDLLRILAWLLPKPYKVPANTYRAKKLVSPFTMGVERIPACPNHCILYRGDTFKDLKECPVCSASRYKNNAGYCSDDNQGPSIETDDATLGISEKQSKIPVMVMWHLPVSDRLRRFFSNPKDAELMRCCNSDQCKKGDKKL